MPVRSKQDRAKLGACVMMTVMMTLDPCTLVRSCCCRPLPAVFEEQWASMEPGNRGGIRVPGVNPHISLTADK